MIARPEDLKLPPNLSPSKRLVMPGGPKREKRLLI
jgi:hypothetical protein